MRSFQGNPLAPPLDLTPLRPDPPAWVGHVLADASTMASHATDSHAVKLAYRRNDTFTLISASVREPAAANADRLADVVASVYRSVGQELRRQHRHTVRIWNFVPNIQGLIDGAGDRYMAFNLGRFAAYCDWFGGPRSFQAGLPTSSAVGIGGDVLWVHALAADVPGVAVENPRQIPSYRYSRRYGVRPPCFARATKVGSRLLIGGTASILGEQSRHAGDVRAQTRETFQNLGALITAAVGGPLPRPLASLRSLRVHLRDAADAPVVHALLDETAPGIADVELVQAPLCRRDLLVEIEGVAECPIPTR